MPPLPPRNCSQHAGDRRCPGRAAAQCWFCEQWFCGDHITVTPCAKPICHVDAAIKRIFAAWKARTQQASQVRPERPRMIVVAGRQRVSSWVPTGPHTLVMGEA